MILFFLLCSSFYSYCIINFTIDVGLLHRIEAGLERRELRFMIRIFNILLGCFLTGMGTLLLQHAHLVIGGTAGLSLSLSYLWNVPFSVLFFIINIPFYIFSIVQMGWNFTLATFLAITALSGITAGMESWLAHLTVPSWVGAAIGGILAGAGLSILFANQASLGGANILALFLRDKCGFNPGITNFIFDGIVVAFGIYSAGFEKGFYSVMAVLVISTVIGLWKKQRSAIPISPISMAQEKI